MCRGEEIQVQSYVRILEEFAVVFVWVTIDMTLGVQSFSMKHKTMDASDKLMSRGLSVVLMVALKRLFQPPRLFSAAHRRCPINVISKEMQIPCG